MVNNIAIQKIALHSALLFSSTRIKKRLSLFPQIETMDETYHMVRVQAISKILPCKKSMQFETLAPRFRVTRMTLSQTSIQKGI
jgi:hypothetical protein